MSTHAPTDERIDKPHTDGVIPGLEEPSDIPDSDTCEPTAAGHAGDDDDETAPSGDGEESDETPQAQGSSDDGTQSTRRPVPWSRVLAFGILPALVMLLAAGVGYLKWQEANYRGSEVAAAQSVSAATDTTVAILSYQADTADKELTAARDRLTGSFRDDYTKLINELVIPGAKEKKISVTATVPQAASVSATPNHAVVLVYVNQTTNVANDPPSDTASAVLVTLDKDGDNWLVSKFDPV
ncbi:hypothetical protein MMAD_55530 (plasmid) [Mycolicibacterium madagascariense]|uniref:Outer membrane protein n=1 Tax=Mycolicibacterium madagascariense TaxID=212765 RepID=A0A7I7XPU5_9MYCO|nr:hypothetical protein [Mycolicibacterium madagascariense]BBZ31258.1 hypothetical protein MMAD_55530 [Mycolicibacterium madagascariense]